MLLRDDTGTGVEVRVAGYQFPEADDARKRFSWHVVEGHAWAPEGDWAFRYPALTCDESPRVGSWLRAAAGSLDVPPLRFTEPNLGLRSLTHDAAHVTLAVELDIEFLPPWRKPKEGPMFAGNPWVIEVRLHREEIARAADAWHAELSQYPDRLSEGIG